MRTYSDLWDAVYSECRRMDAEQLGAVCDRAHVPLSTMRAYLNGREGIGYARVRALADALDTVGSVEIEVVVRDIPCSRRA